MSDVVEYGSDAGSDATTVKVELEGEESEESEGSVESDGSELDRFQVEKIVGRRVISGKISYLIKWKKEREDENSWETVDTIGSQNLEVIAEFEKELALKEKNAAETPGEQKPGPSCSRNAGGMGKETSGSFGWPPEHGFARGLIPEKILGATDTSGELLFLIKWKGTDENDLVPAHQANIKCPQIVIQFYEQHIVLKDEDA